MSAKIPVDAGLAGFDKNLRQLDGDLQRSGHSR
jgi:hypothetical protein